MKPRFVILIAVGVSLAAAAFAIARPQSYMLLFGAFIFDVAAALYIMVTWHARVSVYVCPNCSHRFSISAGKDFISPHTCNSKRLRCPSCGATSWCEIV